MATRLDAATSLRIQNGLDLINEHATANLMEVQHWSDDHSELTEFCRRFYLSRLQRAIDDATSVYALRRKLLQGPWTRSKDLVLTEIYSLIHWWELRALPNGAAGALAAYQN